MEIKRRDLLGAGAALGLGMATRSMLGQEPAARSTAAAAEQLTSPETPGLALQFKSGVFQDGSGNRLPYRYFEPPAQASGKCPVILYLHGEDEAGTDNKAQLTTTECATVWVTPAHLAENRVYVLAPQLPKGQEWTSEPAYSNTLALLKQFIEKHPDIDSNRVYIIGFSMGATGLWTMLLKNPQLFAAAMPISGSADSHLGDTQYPSGQLHGCRLGC